MANITPPSITKEVAPSLYIQGAPTTPSPQLNYLQREPVQASNSLTALIAALSILVKPWLNISNESQLAIVTVIAIVGPLLAGIYSRSKVTPVAKLPESVVENL